MAWTKDSITEALTRLSKKNTDLSYAAMTRKRQSLVSAASYHFGSYRRAVEEARIDYAEVSRRPRWTTQKVIALIKGAKRKGEDLHWSAVTARRDELGRAAFAAVQPRLFGSWDRALHAAGLHSEDVAIYRTWDRSTVVSDLKDRAHGGDTMTSSLVQSEDPSLHAAAVRYFGSFKKSMTAAKLLPKARARRVTVAPSASAVRQRTAAKRRPPAGKPKK